MFSQDRKAKENRSGGRSTGSSFFSAIPVQAKLKINEPNDKYEQEADRVADEVVRTPESPIGKIVPSSIQRKCEACEDEELNRKENSEETPTLSPDLEAHIGTLTGGGRPMNGEEKSFFEPRFGRDFSSVKIHENDPSAEKINARAYTTGNHIVFNPSESPNNKRLMAHELTHVVQQGGMHPVSVQRQPSPNPESAPTASPTDADYRMMVTSAVDFLNNGAGFYPLMTNITRERIDTVIEGLHSTITSQERIISEHLSNDAILLQDLRTAYTAAVRALLARAAGQLNTSLFSQYILYIDKIPRWAWPDASALGANNDAQKRAFIASVTATFSNTGIFSNLGSIDNAKLEEVLTRLNATVVELETTINNQLGGDAALRRSLHNSFRSAISRLLSLASIAIGQSDFNLFMRYRYGTNRLIPDWVDQGIAGISTQIPVGAAADPLTGEITMRINGMNVVIQTDTTRTRAGGETTFNINAGQLSWRGRNGAIQFSPPLAVPQITIRTAYGPGLSATSSSGYGRGTTAADQSAGNTSLGFHEGSHGRSYLDYLYNHPFPVFTGKSTMTVAQFRAAIRTWETAVRAYNRELERFSELTVDCVGTSIETYYQGLGQVSPVNCTPP